MALPTSRDITLAPGASAVPAALLNKLQDMIIGNKKPTMYRQSLPRPLYPYTFGGGLAYTFGAGGAESYLATTTGDQWAMSLDMESGDRLTSVELRVRGDGAADTTYTLASTSGTTQLTTILFQGTLTNLAAAWTTIPLHNFASLGGGASIATPFSVATLGDYQSLYLFVNTVSGAHRYGNVRWGYDRL